jgi:Ca2+/Na+ antiporter
MHKYLLVYLVGIILCNIAHAWTITIIYKIASVHIEEAGKVHEKLKWVTLVYTVINVVLGIWASIPGSLVNPNCSQDRLWPHVFGISKTINGLYVIVVVFGLRCRNWGIT